MSATEAQKNGYAITMDFHYLRMDYSVKKVIRLDWLLKLGFIEDYHNFDNEYLIAKIDSDGEDIEYSEEMLDDWFASICDRIYEGLE
jgi:hypothetical protein